MSAPPCFVPPISQKASVSVSSRPVGIHTHGVDLNSGRGRRGLGGGRVVLVRGHVGDFGGRAGEADDGRTRGDGRAREPGSGAERGAEHGEWWLLTESLSLKLSLSRRPVVAQATVTAWLPPTAFRRILVWPHHVVGAHVCGWSDLHYGFRLLLSSPTSPHDQHGAAYP